MTVTADVTRPTLTAATHGRPVLDARAALNRARAAFRAACALDDDDLRGDRIASASQARDNARLAAEDAIRAANPGATESAIRLAVISL